MLTRKLLRLQRVSFAADVHNLSLSHSPTRFVVGNLPALKSSHYS